MKKISNSRIAIEIHPITGYPFAAEVADSTLWPSERATRQALHTLVEINNLGYAGLRFQYSRLNTSETLLSRSVNLSTPEGHLVVFIMDLAEQGIALATNQALGLLEKIYQSEGLPLPTPRPLTEQIYLSEIEA